MENVLSLPWTRIHDYLADVGAARTLEEFDRRVLRGIGALIPHEATAASFVSHGGVPPCRGVSRGWERHRHAFNARYRHKVPVPIAGRPPIWLMDFSQWSDSELVRDFVRPAGIGHGLCVTRGRYQVAVLRARGEPPFSPRDFQVLAVLQPHLNNLFRLHSGAALAGRTTDGFPSLPALTGREQQIARCLFARMTCREIGSVLGISHRTAERHVQNIYDKLGVRTRSDFRDLLD